MPSHAYRGIRPHAHRPGGRHDRHLAPLSLSRRRGDAQRGDQPARARHGQGLPDDLVELQSLDTARQVSARHWSELDPARPAAAAGARRASLPRRARQRDHAGRIAGRRRHRRVVRADHRALRSAGPIHRRVHESGRSAAGGDEHRVPDDSCADRRAGLSARDVRRHRGDRAPGGRRQACRARRRPPGARTANRPGLHGRAAALGHEQLGDHQAAHRRRSRHLRLLRAHSRHGGRDARGVDARATGTKSAGRSPSSGTTGSGSRRA